MIEISVVVPMFNEEGCVDEFIKRTQISLENESYELIIVNDGSIDGTEEKIFSHMGVSSNSKIKYIKHRENMGQSLAIASGFKESKGKYVVMMDADLQNRPEDIMKLVAQARKGFDLVSGRRVARVESVLKRQIPSYLGNLFIRLITGSKIKDHAGFNCIDGDLARSLEIKKGFQIFIPAMVHKLGKKYTEINVVQEKRYWGESKYDKVPRMREIILNTFKI